MDVIKLKDKFGQFDGYWQPKIVASMNGQYLKLAKFKGEFEWHSHADEDEFFQVFEGQIEIYFREKVVTLNKGECLVVPKGVEHKPVAHEEAQVMMFEPASTKQTGEQQYDRTVDISEQQWL